MTELGWKIQKLQLIWCDFKLWYRINISKEGRENKRFIEDMAKCFAKFLM